MKFISRFRVVRTFTSFQSIPVDVLRGMDSLDVESELFRIKRQVSACFASGNYTEALQHSNDLLEVHVMLVFERYYNQVF